jgi:hypothetical protein
MIYVNIKNAHQKTKHHRKLQITALSNTEKDLLDG